MALSIYDASVPVLVRGLGNLSAILEKGVAYAEARKVDPSVLVGSRLAFDMLPLSAQIQIASDTCKGVGARLTGAEAPSWPDTETTFPELQARIKTTVDYLKSLDRGAFDGGETREVTLKFPTGEMKFTGQEFLFGFALPNFFFHLTTAYAILRHNGVEIGKFDYLGAR